MIKKVIGLLILPYFIFMFLEGCWNSQCDRRETRNITDINMLHLSDSILGSYQSIILEMKYESYFVTNFKPDLLRKAYARKIKEDFCFEGYSNPIENISIISSNDFDSNYRAGKELNEKFIINNERLSETNFQSIGADNYWQVPNSIYLYNDSIPSLDSIHTLYFNIYCADGKTYLDTLENVNLNRTINRYYF